MSMFIRPTSVEMRNPMPTIGVPKNSATMAPISARVELIFSALKMNGAAAGSLSLNKVGQRSEEHTSELQSLMRISYAVFCLKKKKYNTITTIITYYLNRHHQSKTINTPNTHTKSLTTYYLQKSTRPN